MPFQEVELEENFLVSLISEAALDSTEGSNEQQSKKKKNKKKTEGSRNARPKVRKELQQPAAR